MTKPATDKTKYINFDSICLRYLYNGDAKAWRYIIATASEQLDERTRAELSIQLPDGLLSAALEPKKNQPGLKQNFLVSCKLQDFLNHYSNTKKTMQLFAVKVALMSICRKKHWDICRRQLLFSRVCGYKNSVDIKTIKDNLVAVDKFFPNKTKQFPDGSEKKIYKSNQWNTLKKHLSKEGINFYSPIGNGINGFIFGTLSVEDLKYHYECSFIDKNTTDEQRTAAAKHLQIPFDDNEKKDNYTQNTSNYGKKLQKRV